MSNEPFQLIPGGVLAREDPPPPPRRTGGGARGAANWQLISQQLRADPDTWYKVAIGSAALAQRPKIDIGKTGNWRPAGSFVSCTRTIDGETHLYVKFLSQPQQPPAEEPDES